MTSRQLGLLPARSDACPEEIAYRLDWIDGEQLERLAYALSKSGYGQYLLKVRNERFIR